MINMELKNIVLIGMPGVGKSTIGVVLAKTAGMPFLDTDLVIQQREGIKLQEIIDKEGLGFFLSIEEKAILELNNKGHVIATGGSVIYSEAAMEHLKKGGKVIYLMLPFWEIERRINNITTRGIVMGKGQSLVDIYNERIPLYNKYADLIIDCSEKNAEAVIEDILEKLQFF